MVLFIDRVTIGTKSVVLGIVKSTPVTLLLASANTQSFFFNKQSSTLTLINGKLCDVQKILRYFSRIVTSAFVDGTSGYVGLFLSLGFQIGGGLFSSLILFCT